MSTAPFLLRVDLRFQILAIDLSSLSRFLVQSLVPFLSIWFSLFLGELLCIEQMKPLPQNRSGLC